MPFPDEIETGADETEKARLSLAGPTADIRHLESHAAAGAPAMFTALQESIIGTGVPLNTWNPTWTGTSTPATNNVYWRKVGAVVFVYCEFSWAAAHVSVTGGSIWSGSYPAGWGTVLGAVIPGRGVLTIYNGVTRPLSIQLQGSSQSMYYDDTGINFFGAGDSFRGSGVVMLA